MIRERFEQHRIGAELQIAEGPSSTGGELEPRLELVGNSEQSGAVFLP
jgi:hypothetical protein